MRAIIVGMTLLVLAFSSHAQDGKKKGGPRFGFEVDETTFPQQKPDDAMKSIGRALDRMKVDYMLAQLVDPVYVDYWVDRYKDDFTQGKEAGKRLLGFNRLVRETSEYYLNDPLIVKDLRLFAKEGKWEEMDGIAVGTSDKAPARKVFLKKIGERWFLLNKQE